MTHWVPTRATSSKSPVPWRPVRCRPRSSAASFAGGAALPLLVAAVAPASSLLAWVASTALVFLALLGGVAARTGGASVLVGASARDLLGCAGHGHHGRRGGAVRGAGGVTWVGLPELVETGVSAT